MFKIFFSFLTFNGNEFIASLHIYSQITHFSYLYVKGNNLILWLNYFSSFLFILIFNFSLFKWIFKISCKLACTKCEMWMFENEHRVSEWHIHIPCGLHATEEKLICVIGYPIATRVHNALTTLQAHNHFLLWVFFRVSFRLMLLAPFHSVTRLNSTETCLGYRVIL